MQASPPTAAASIGAFLRRIRSETQPKNMLPGIAPRKSSETAAEAANLETPQAFST